LPYYVNCDIIKRYTNGNPVGVVAKELDMLGTGETVTDVMNTLRNEEHPRCELSIVEITHDKVTRRSTTTVALREEITKFSELLKFIAAAPDGSTIRSQWAYGDGVMVVLTIRKESIICSSKEKTPTVTVAFSGENITIHSNSKKHTFNEVLWLYAFSTRKVELPEQIIKFIEEYLPKV